MRRCERVLGMAMATTLLLWATPSAAQMFPAGGTNAVAGALALPVDIRGSGRVTEIVITNAGNAVSLHLNLLYVQNDAWRKQDWSCDVTANETTLFEFAPDEMGSPSLFYECTSVFTGEAVEFKRGTPFETAILFVTVEGPGKSPTAGITLGSNQIFGDSTVIDFNQTMAYSFEAIPFGAIFGGNDGNRQYKFDGFEYAQFPEKLAANFLAPTADDLVTAELFLFTLDGRSGGSANTYFLVDIYNDDEVYTSAEWWFDCMTVVPLGIISPSFLRHHLGSPAGHFVLTPDLVDYEEGQHDVTFGNSNEMRVTPIHGWLIQSAQMGATIGYGGNQMLYGDPAWGRALAQSTMPLAPDGTDVPTFNAGCPTAPCPP